MKKQLILLLILCFPFFSNYGQTQKVMTTDDDFDGKLTYQYYEDTKTSEYVKHGSYKYSRSKQMSGGTYNFTIIGQYKHGQKDGIWNIIETLVDYPNNAGSYTTGSENLLQSYKDGIANGEWRYSKEFKTRSKLYNREKYLWSTYKTDDNPQFASAFFVDGIATGTIIYKDMFMNSKRTITLNKDGYLVGNYILSDNVFQNSTELAFNEDGIITKNVTRDVSGKVTTKNDLDENLISTVVQYSKNQITKKQLVDSHIKLDTLNISNIFNFAELFDYTKAFGFQASNSNKPDLNSSTIEIFSYGRYIYPKKIELINIKENALYFNARKNFDKDSFDELLKQHSFEMSDSDIAKVNREKEALENFALYKPKFSENCERMIDKLTVYKKPNVRTEISILALKSISTEVDKIDTIHADTKNRMNSEIDKMSRAIKAVSDFDSDDFVTFNYKKSYEISVESLSAINNVFVPLANNITSTMSKAEKADKLISELNDNYGQSNNATINAMITSGLTKAQKTLFEVYNEIIAYQKQELQISKNSNTTNLILDNIILVNEKTKELKNSDLKELLKSMKKAKSIEEKINLIEN